MQSKKKGQLLFSGYYGQFNTGDDAFGLIALWGACKYWKACDGKLLVNRGPISDSFEVNYAFSNKQLFRGQHRLISYFEILKSSYNILAGGSIFNSIPNIGSPRRLMFDLANRKLSKVGAIGVSLGPFKRKSDFNFYVKALKNFSFLALRDVSSFELAKSIGLPYDPIQAADLAFLLPKMIPEIQVKSSSEIKIIGITVCHYERYSAGNLDNESRREKVFIETLKILTKTNGVLFRFFIFNNHPKVGDKILTMEIIHNLSLDKSKYDIVEYNNKTIHTYRKIEECDAMFSTRLHGAIFSAAANVPSILVEYHKKCTSYIHDINIADKWRIGDMDMKPEDVAKLILELAFSKSDFEYRDRQNLINLAEKNFSSPSLF